MSNIILQIKVLQPCLYYCDESEKIYQIGVYEISKKRYDKGKYLDEDGDLDISKL